MPLASTGDKANQRSDAETDNPTWRSPFTTIHFPARSRHNLAALFLSLRWLARLCYLQGNTLRRAHVVSRSIDDGCEVIILRSETLVAGGTGSRKSTGKSGVNGSSAELRSYQQNPFHCASPCRLGTDSHGKVEHRMQA